MHRRMPTHTHAHTKRNTYRTVYKHTHMYMYMLIHSTDRSTHTHSHKDAQFTHIACMLDSTSLKHHSRYTSSRRPAVRQLHRTVWSSYLNRANVEEGSIRSSFCRLESDIIHTHTYKNTNHTYTYTVLYIYTRTQRTHTYTGTFTHDAHTRKILRQRRGLTSFAASTMARDSTPFPRDILSRFSNSSSAARFRLRESIRVDVRCGVAVCGACVCGVRVLCCVLCVCVFVLDENNKFPIAIERLKEGNTPTHST